MFEPLIALGLFGGMVWMIAQAILMLVRTDGDSDVSNRQCDTLMSFVEENYGGRFVPEDPLGEEGMRKL